MHEISNLRKQISNANIKRTKLLGSIIESEPFIAAQVYERYKKCGNKNCKCTRGELHGPFLWIYQKKKGQQLISTTVNKQKAIKACKLSENYAKWTDARKKIREIELEIQGYLNELEKILEKEVLEYTTEKNVGRPKKEVMEDK